MTFHLCVKNPLRTQVLWLQTNHCKQLQSNSWNGQSNMAWL